MIHDEFQKDFHHFACELLLRRLLWNAIVEDNCTNCKRASTTCLRALPTMVTICCARGCDSPFRVPVQHPWPEETASMLKCMTDRQRGTANHTAKDMCMGLPTTGQASATPMRPSTGGVRGLPHVSFADSWGAAPSAHCLLPRGALVLPPGNRHASVSWSQKYLHMPMSAVGVKQRLIRGQCVHASIERVWMLQGTGGMVLGWGKWPKRTAF